MSNSSWPISSGCSADDDAPAAAVLLTSPLCARTPASRCAAGAQPTADLGPRRQLARHQRRRLVQCAARLRDHHRERLRRRLGLRQYRAGPVPNLATARRRRRRPACGRSTAWPRHRAFLADQRRLGEGQRPPRGQALGEKRRRRAGGQRDRRLPAARRGCRGAKGFRSLVTGRRPKLRWQRAGHATRPRLGRWSRFRALSKPSEGARRRGQSGVPGSPRDVRQACD